MPAWSGAVQRGHGLLGLGLGLAAWDEGWTFAPVPLSHVLDEVDPKTVDFKANENEAGRGAPCLGVCSLAECLATVENAPRNEPFG